MVGTRRASEGSTAHLLLDPEETAFARLVEDLAEAPPTEGRSARQAVRGDEFTCAGCHLVLHITRMVDHAGGRCIDCALADAAR